MTPPLPSSNTIQPDNDTLKPLHHTLEQFESLGDAHFSGNAGIALRADAFECSDDEKINIIAHHFKAIMETLGLDLQDDSLAGTPYRVAKMYVKEIFSGINPDNRPKITLFNNHYAYQHMLVEKNITFHSTCEHHFVPIQGKAHIAYFPNGKVVGLSKINRLVQHYARQPQVQERLTMQLLHEFKTALQSEDVAVLINADHLCVQARGVQDIASSTVTAQYSGKFLEDAVQQEFLRHVYAV
ncbi:MAG: GTP cyclohydrolase I FolE [Sphingobacteriales bacterium]|nr:GTP cyclohydrolase I FolE [Sphingobacteriales bacterium]